jgi:hypothetical protein
MEVIGELKITTAGSYTFKLSSDDGSKLLVDGTQLAAMWKSQGLESTYGTRTLSAGIHTIQTMMF